jgi:2-polyprenyl-6-methoxyphenol hydroxylase-like FAD-dependent oxidoreductase
MKPLKIVIVGAGIGGLEVALALAMDGHQILVLDSVTEFGDVILPSLQF